MIIAHVGGLPVEEVLPALMSGVGGCLILRLTPLGSRVRRLLTWVASWSRVEHTFE